MISQEFTDIPDKIADGDHMTIEDFKDIVSAGFICSSDGVAFFATETQESHLITSIGHVMAGNTPEWATHIVWYNK